jgi:hypothetical protein
MNRAFAQLRGLMACVHDPGILGPASSTSRRRWPIRTTCLLAYGWSPARLESRCPAGRSLFGYAAHQAIAVGVLSCCTRYHSFRIMLLTSGSKEIRTPDLLNAMHFRSVRRSLAPSDREPTTCDNSPRECGSVRRILTTVAPQNWLPGPLGGVAQPPTGRGSRPRPGHGAEDRASGNGGADSNFVNGGVGPLAADERNILVQLGLLGPGSAGRGGRP